MDTTTSVQCSLTHTIHVHHILASFCNQERAHCNESMAGIFHEFTIIPFSFMSLHLRPCSSSLRSLSEINHNSDSASISRAWRYCLDQITMEDPDLSQFKSAMDLNDNLHCRNCCSDWFGRPQHTSAPWGPM